MTKTSLALAVALLTSTTLAGTANAGGLRVGLGFGFPLGAFVAHEHLSDSSSYSERHCDRPRVARSVRNDDDDQPVHKVRHSVSKDDVAEVSQPHKVVKIEKPEIKDVEIKTAKLDDKSTVSDAAPSIFVPDSPPSKITGTQSTPATLHTAALTAETTTTTTQATTPPTDPVKTDTAKSDKTDDAKTDDAPKSKVSVSDVKRLCRRFSAAVAGLIDVPCE
jgi:hypothetical protein